VRTPRIREGAALQRPWNGGYGEGGKDEKSGDVTVPALCVQLQPDYPYGRQPSGTTTEMTWARNVSAVAS
jgi:hypothetical protein